MEIAKSGGGKQEIAESPVSEWLQNRDLVCAFDVLEHIEHDREALAEWAGWLRAGGKLCISVPAHRSRWGAGDEWAGHWRRYDRSDIESLVRSAGFSIEHIECYGFPLGNVTEWYGERFYRRALKERQGELSKAEATGESGVDRAFYLRKFRWLDSMPGRGFLLAANMAQKLTSRTDWGTGYVLLARRT
jgi:SAM-dependent methyltransferase